MSHGPVTLPPVAFPPVLVVAPPVLVIVPPLALPPVVVAVPPVLVVPPVAMGPVPPVSVDPVSSGLQAAHRTSSEPSVLDTNGVDLFMVSPWVSR